MEVLILAVIASLILVKALKNQNEKIEIFCTLAPLPSVAGIAVLVFEAVCNPSNHVGWEPWIFAFVFLPALTMGSLGLRFPGLRWPASFSMLSGACGMTVLVYLDQTNSLLSYSRWILRGVP